MKNSPKFPLGRIVITAGASETLKPKIVNHALKRHHAGDWGDLCKDDQAENGFSLDKRLRLFSAYEYDGEPKFWIITEADRSATTILLPEEY